MAHLQSLGFRTSVDWLPSRAEVARADGRRVDLHPVTFSPDGSAVQAGRRDGELFLYAADGFATGRINGRVVPCLSVAQLLRFREGYELRPVDHHDLRILRKHQSAS